MMSQRVERTWIHTGGYGRFRGEWVKMHLLGGKKKENYVQCAQEIIVKKKKQSEDNTEKSFHFN